MIWDGSSRVKTIPLNPSSLHPGDSNLSLQWCSLSNGILFGKENDPGVITVEYLWIPRSPNGQRSRRQIVKYIFNSGGEGGG